MTKVLARQSSIPDLHADNKENYVDYNLLANIVEEGVLFSYYYSQIKAHKTG